VLKDKHNKYEQLRTEYSFFVYEKFSIRDQDDKLSVTYHFNLADQIFFYPTLEFIKGDFFNKALPEPLIRNFIFHIGLIELISYWKAACPPKIIIKPFHLDDEQIAWWKNLWYHGLGEFFFLNKIQTNADIFVDVVCQSDQKITPERITLDNTRVLIPVGGGKDSIVTLELLKPHYKCIPFVVNQRKASLEAIRMAGFDEGQFITVNRTIHPELLRMNDLGFLNGHTPFSALLAFIGAFSASMAGIRSVALSNESSANEPTDYESGVNHQYSKSFSFENDFRVYLESYLTPDVNYFSFLRPVNEYVIASLFAGFPAYFSVFKSCNVGSKVDSWCGHCPKCLFTFIILSPFLSKKKLIEIFGKDLLDDRILIGSLNDLAGISQTKPFECVGTTDEVNYALIRAVEKRGENLPELLKYYISTPYFYRFRDYTREEIIRLETKEHFLEDRFMTILKKAIHA
jgi:hypothetical protein